jgi:hypothetical protein
MAHFGDGSRSPTEHQCLRKASAFIISIVVGISEVLG